VERWGFEDVGINKRRLLNKALVGDGLCVIEFTTKVPTKDRFLVG